jgi:hypothetical protein
MVGQAIEQGASEPLGAKHAGPFIERQVAGHDGGASLVALAEDLEQQFGAGLRQRHIAEFVDDQELVAGDLALQAQEPLLVAGLNQLLHEGGGGREADRQAFLAGCQTEPQCDMALAGAGVADRDDVLTPLDVF